MVCIIEGFALIATMMIGPALLGQHTDPKRRGVIMGLWAVLCLSVMLAPCSLRLFYSRQGVGNHYGMLAAGQVCV